LAEQALPQLELHWFPFVQRGIDVQPVTNYRYV
jgi:hypothetical protein